MLNTLKHDSGPSLMFSNPAFPDSFDYHAGVYFLNVSHIRPWTFLFQSNLAVDTQPPQKNTGQLCICQDECSAYW